MQLVFEARVSTWCSTDFGARVRAGRGVSRNIVMGCRDIAGFVVCVVVGI